MTLAYGRLASVTTEPTHPADPAPAPAHPHTASPHRSLLHHRDFQLLMGGRLLAVVGASMTGMAMMLLAYDLSHDAGTSSVVMSFWLIGNLVIGLPAGALVDRWDRKRTMVVTALLAAAVLGTVPVALYLERLTIVQLCLVTFLVGGLSSFYAPAEQASIKRLVPTQQLGEAMSLNQVRGSVGSIIGPPLAGVLYALGRGLPIIGNAVAELIAALCAGLVRADLKAEPTGRKHILSEIGDGLRYVFTHRILMPVAVLACLINFGFNAILTAVTLNMRAMEVPPGIIGLLETVAGVASIVGALLSAPLLKRFRVGTMLAIGFPVLTVMISLIVFFHQPWQVMVIVGLICLMLPAGNAGVMAYFLSIVPDHLQGRASSALVFVSMGLMPLASMLAGFLLQHVSLTAAILTGIVPCAVSAALSLLLPVLREIGRAEEFGEMAAAA